MKQECYKNRVVERKVIDIPGEIQFMLDKYFIYGDGNQRYEPCEVPLSFKKAGLKVIFSGEIMTINPEERRAGIPIQLSAIAKVKD
ncbi:MAG: hypothetical protein IPN29_11735 [Saprospiraceae bacterium]|nr:hypothetical protein [Saprospiraceae bacterium]